MSPSNGARSILKIMDEVKLLISIEVFFLLIGSIVGLNVGVKLTDRW